MSLCTLYLQNLKKHAFECKMEKYNSEHVSDNATVFYDCSDCKQCHRKLNIPFRSYKDANTVINYFSSDQIELVKYKKNFQILDDSENLTGNLKKLDIDGEEIYLPKEGIRDWHLKDNYRLSSGVERNFNKVDDILVPVNKNIRDWNLFESIRNCSRRAQNNYYGFALANKWKYFVTCTVSPDKCDRFNDEEVKRLWSLFIHRVKRFDNKAKILGVPERHESGALHFHALIDTDKDFDIEIYYNKKGDAQYSKTGAPLFTFKLWDFGLCTLAILPAHDNQSAVINYLITYTTKQCNLGYGNRRFYRTQNLSYKKSFCDYTTDTYCEDFISNFSLQVYKETDSLIVYRNFNIKNPEEVISDFQTQDDFTSENETNNMTDNLIDFSLENLKETYLSLSENKSYKNFLSFISNFGYTTQDVVDTLKVVDDNGFNALFFEFEQLKINFENQ